MAIRKIVYLPEPVLRTPAREVSDFNEELQQLIDDMFETMYHANGVGLAAPQIGVGLQVAVLDVHHDDNKIVIINPEILEAYDEQLMQEGCLSVPGSFDKVKRANRVKLRALNRQGERFELSAEGLLAQALQHETQHLHGKLYIDLLSPIRRTRAKHALQRFKRQQK